ncbi:MAG: carboxypeptidase regulatory-like domain-containing protein [Vicinamibacterales bacterium]
MVFWLLLVLLGVSPPAQITTGTLAGTVIDATGRPIAGASVVVISETQTTRTASLLTTSTGTYVVPALRSDSYRIEVTIAGFKTLTRGGIRLSGGDRVALDPLVLEIGGTQETVDVRDEAPMIQAQTGERSGTVDRNQLENLPIASHDFQQFIALTPGVNGTTRIGGGGQNNYMIDGVSAMDTGNNGLMGGLNLPVDAVAEVKVLTSGYQAEYGRSSGLQVSAVTRSGTNRFQWSLFNYQRSSGLGANSWANRQNGDPKPVVQQLDVGYTLGGPIGRPGRDNRLFFFYSHEYRPRRVGDYVTHFRVPTLLERRGDFSETRDQNGQIYRLIYDPASGRPKSACTVTDTSACFKDAGVLGRIPTSRLYGPGLALLSQYPLPNRDAIAGQSFNYGVKAPIEVTLSYTPVIRIDYQAATRLRLTGKWNGTNSLVRPAIGSLPGFNDTLQKFPLSFNTSMTMNYAVGTTGFLEATMGMNQNRLGAPPITPYTNRNNVACPPDTGALVAHCTLGEIASLFPAAGTIDPRYYEYAALQTIGVPFFENSQSLLPPQINWFAAGTASRLSANGCDTGSCAPPSLNYPGFMNINRTHDVVVSFTKIAGRHTAKAGLYINHSYKAQNLGSSPNFQGLLNFGNDTSNPLDTSFPFANAALGIFSSYAQQSRFIEGSFIYDNVEWYLQDNWKTGTRLTLDYGVRWVHQTPQHDRFNQTSNFFPGQWTKGAAPLLYAPACAQVTPCSDPDRQARHPVTGVLLGAGTSSLIGQAVPGTGDPANGLVQAGRGIADTGYLWPSLAVAPRVGAAYDVTGRQRVVIRGSAGLFFDRPDGNTVFNTIGNPPVATGLTQQWGNLSDLSDTSLSFGPVPTVRVYYYDSKLPSDVQWNGGVQWALPWSSRVDVSYVGHHAYHVLGGQQAGGAVNLNTIDLGTTLALSGQDSTQTAGTALPNNLLRPYRGYSNILVQWGRFHRTFHSLQTSVTRRLRGGFAAGVNWTWTISDSGNTGLPSPQLRIDHAEDGSYGVRPDQATAEALFADQGRVPHILVANVTWVLPHLAARNRFTRKAGVLLNGWQLSGVFRYDSGAPYDVTYSYETGGGASLTGSPDYTARVLVTGDPGSGCSSDQYQQFNTAAFSGPLPGSNGLESGRNLLRGCGDHRVDVSVRRSVKFLFHRQLELRLDIFNALNSVIFNGRSATLQLTAPAQQTILNAQYLADGRLAPDRLQPENAGFGAATNAMAPRAVQVQGRLKF